MLISILRGVGHSDARNRTPGTTCPEKEGLLRVVPGLCRCVSAKHLLAHVLLILQPPQQHLLALHPPHTQHTHDQTLSTSFSQGTATPPHTTAHRLIGPHTTAHNSTELRHATDITSRHVRGSEGLQLGGALDSAPAQPRRPPSLCRSPSASRTPILCSRPRQPSQHVIRFPHHSTSSGFLHRRHLSRSRERRSARDKASAAGWPEHVRNKKRGGGWSGPANDGGGDVGVVGEGVGAVVDALVELAELEEALRQ
eukprot:1974737-Rhodomonas_salina.1